MALNVAVIGLGWWGRIIVPLARTSAKLRVVRVADPAPAAAGFATEQGLPLSKDLDEVLRDPQVQGVVLCTPHTQHTEQIVRAANGWRFAYSAELAPPCDALMTMWPASAAST